MALHCSFYNYHTHIGYRLPPTTQAPRTNSQRGKARPKTSRVPRPMRTYKYHVMLPNETFTQASTVQYYAGSTLGSLSPQMAFLDQYTTYGALYDQYRINRITWTFRPMYESANFTGTSIPPLLFTAIDYDDSTPLISLASIREYQDLETHSFETFSITIKPHASNALYNGTSFVAYGNIASPWIDCGSANVPHHGLKLAVTAGNGAGQTVFQYWFVTTVLDIEFRSVR